MAPDRRRPNTAILARHMAGSGKYRDVIAIEADLILKGRGDLILLLEDPSLRAELNSLCVVARTEALKREVKNTATPQRRNPVEKR